MWQKTNNKNKTTPQLTIYFIRKWTTMGGIVYTSLALIINSIYLYGIFVFGLFSRFCRVVDVRDTDVLPLRIATSPLPAIDCIENTIYCGALAGALLCLLFEQNFVVLVPSSKQKKQ
jgi:hypothetical protein